MIDILLLIVALIATVIHYLPIVVLFVIFPGLILFVAYSDAQELLSFSEDDCTIFRRRLHQCHFACPLPNPRVCWPKHIHRVGEQ